MIKVTANWHTNTDCFFDNPVQRLYSYKYSSGSDNKQNMPMDKWWNGIISSLPKAHSEECLCLYEPGFCTRWFPGEWMMTQVGRSNFLSLTAGLLLENLHHIIWHGKHTLSITQSEVEIHQLPVAREIKLVCCYVSGLTVKVLRDVILVQSYTPTHQLKSDWSDLFFCEIFSLSLDGLQGENKLRTLQ